jgi:hypothetical protein
MTAATANRTTNYQGSGHICERGPIMLESNGTGDLGVRRFRERLAFLYTLRNSLIALAFWGAVYGVVVLAARSFFHVERLPLLWGLASLPAVLAVAAVLAWRSLPSSSAVRALVDSHGRCGGLVVASEEVPLGNWSRNQREPDAPLPQWNASPSIALCAVGPVFLLAAFLMPASLVQADSKLDVGRDVERMEEQIAAMKEEKILDAKRAQAMKAELDDIRRNASGRDPVKTLEALDSMQARLNHAAQKEAEDAIQHMENLDRAEMLADALAGRGDKLNDPQLAEAMLHLDALVRKAAAEDKLIATHLDPELMDALKKGKKLSAEQLKKLAKALKDGKLSTAGKMARLVKARLIDADQLGKLENAEKGNLAALAAYLKENSVDGADILLEFEVDKGGVDDGPGAAKLRFGDESSDFGAKFLDKELPPADLEKLAGSDLEGVSSAVPKVNTDPTRGPAGALAGSKSGGGSSADQKLLPRHRAAVKRFFDRPAMKKAE